MHMTRRMKNEKVYQFDTLEAQKQEYRVYQDDTKANKAGENEHDPLDSKDSGSGG